MSISSSEPARAGDGYPDSSDHSVEVEQQIANDEADRAASRRKMERHFQREEDAAREEAERQSADREEAQSRPEPRDVFAVDSSRSAVPLSNRHVPDVVWNYARDHAARVGTSTEPVSLACIVATAVASRHGWRVQPKSLDYKWTEPAIIWGAVTGDTGENKSSSMDGMVGVLKSIEHAWIQADAAAVAAYTRALEVYEAGKRAWLADLHAVKKNPRAPQVCPTEPQRVPLRRLSTNDSTVEALVAICADNPAGILVMNDELMSWFASFGAYKAGSGGAAKDKNAFITGFGGRPHSTDRKGKTIYCESFALSVMGAIQDDVLRKDVSKYPADGLMARFLFAKASTFVGQNVAPDAAAATAMESILHRLANGGTGRTVLFSPQAQGVWDQIHRDRVAALKDPSISVPVRQHMAKWDSLHSRLSLVFELMVHPDPTEISLDSAERASRYLREVVLPEVSRIYDDVMGETQEMIDARAIANHILDQRLGTILFSEISGKVSGLRGKDARIGDAMNILVEYGWVTPRQMRSRKGQKKPGISRWEVTPAVHGIIWQRGR